MALSFPLSFPPIAFVKEVSPAERAPPTFELTLCLFSISAALLYAEDAAALALVVSPYLSFTSLAFCAAATAAALALPVMSCSSLNFFSDDAVVAEKAVSYTHLRAHET